jgi:non-haem dioxygenase in morphine synthesis N-terminal
MKPPQKSLLSVRRISGTCVLEIQHIPRFKRSHVFRKSRLQIVNSTACCSSHDVCIRDLADMLTRTAIPAAKLCRSFTSLPIIDIGPLVNPNGSESERLSVGKQLHEACENVGFFYVKNHGEFSIVATRAFRPHWLYSVSTRFCYYNIALGSKPLCGTPSRVRWVGPAML